MVDCEKKNKNTGEMEKRKVTVNVRVERTLEELTEKFEKFGKHVFNIGHQYL